MGNEVDVPKNLDKIMIVYEDCASFLMLLGSSLSKWFFTEIFLSLFFKLESICRES